ncbi:MAG: hypothetical protein PHF00_05105 [Elusimicrobia bacterium]|nr:hypothetical protein [Elusimicrobiota bacterium]
MNSPIERRLEAEEVIVLFSGGCDSVLTALRAYDRFQKVHLVTFLRAGLIHTEHVEQQVDRLRHFQGDAQAYTHRFIRTDRLIEFLLYENYLRNLMRHGTRLASHCGLCKLSFHWRTLTLCLEQGVRRVWDGAVRSAKVYPEQNETILLKPLGELYSRYGIRHETPIYEEGLQVEDELFHMGFHKRRKVKGTVFDQQLVCSQQVLFAMFLRWFLPGRSFAEYEAGLAGFYAEKINIIRELTDEWAGARPDRGAARLAAMLEG